MKNKDFTIPKFNKYAPVEDKNVDGDVVRYDSDEIILAVDDKPKHTNSSAYVSKMKEVAVAMSEDDAKIFCHEIVKKYPHIIFETCINEMISARETISNINEAIKHYTKG